MALGSAAIRAGQAFVEILAEDSKARRVLKQFQTHMQSWATTMNNLGRAMLLPALGLALPIRSATKVFSEFEQEMAKVQARLDATDKGFEQLRKTAVALGKSTAFTATQAATAMTNFAEAGYNSVQISKIMKPALDLAAAGMLDLNEASDIIITTLNTFNLTADQIPGVVDVIAKGSIESASDVRELAQAFTYASAVASTAGMPLQDLVGVLSLLHDAGIKADMAGTSVRGVLLSLTSPSVEAAETMKNLGVQIMDARGNMLSFDNIVGQFQRGLKGIGSAERLNVIGKIFDSRQAAGFAKLLDFGAERIRQRIETVTDSAGTAQRVAEIQLNTLSGSFRQLRGAVESLGITILGSVVGPLRDLAQMVRVSVLMIDEWAKKNPAATRAVLAFAAAFIAAAPTLILMSIALKMAAFAVQPLLLAMTGLRVGVFGVWNAFVLLRAVLGPAMWVVSMRTIRMLTTSLISLAVDGIIFVVTSFMELLSAMSAGFAFLAANPIALVLAAIVGIGVYIVYMSDLWRKSVDKMRTSWNRFTEDAKNAWNGLTNAIRSGRIDLAFEIVTITMRMAWLDMIDFMKTTWEDFSGFIVDVFDQASTNAAVSFMKLQKLMKVAPQEINKAIGVGAAPQEARGFVRWLESIIGIELAPGIKPKGQAFPMIPAENVPANNPDKEMGSRSSNRSFRARRSVAERDLEKAEKDAARILPKLYSDRWAVIEAEEAHKAAIDEVNKAIDAPAGKDEDGRFSHTLTERQKNIKKRQDERNAAEEKLRTAREKVTESESALKFADEEVKRKKQALGVLTGENSPAAMHEERKRQAEERESENKRRREAGLPTLGDRSNPKSPSPKKTAPRRGNKAPAFVPPVVVPDAQENPGSPQFGPNGEPLPQLGTPSTFVPLPFKEGTFVPKTAPIPPANATPEQMLQFEYESRQIERENRRNEARFKREQERRRHKHKLDEARKEAEAALRGDNGLMLDGSAGGRMGGFNLGDGRSSVQGTFSAAAARGLGGNDGVGKKIDTTNKLLKGIKDKKGPAFA